MNNLKSIFVQDNPTIQVIFWQLNNMWVQILKGAVYVKILPFLLQLKKKGAL